MDKAPYWRTGLAIGAIVFLVSVTLLFKTPSQARAQRRTLHIYQNGLNGWPLSILNARGVNGSIHQYKFRIGVIDTGITSHNYYLHAAPVMRFSTNRAQSSGQIHGTEVAGLLVADGNGYSTPRGMVPGADLISIQVSNDSGTNVSSLVEGIKLALKLHLKVINISLGTRYNSPLFKETIETAIRKGVTIVAAAGNHSSSQLDYPAAYPGVIAVADVNDNGVLSDHSNYLSGRTIAAPGTNILTTVPRAPSTTTGVTWFSGTSAATPIVTGICEHLLQGDPTLSSEQLQTILLKSQRFITRAHDAVPVVNYVKAIQLVNQAAGPTHHTKKLS